MRWSSWLVRVLVLGMVPVMIVTIPSVAEAADTAYGPSKMVTFTTTDDDGIDGEGPSMPYRLTECSVNGRWVTAPMQGPGTEGQFVSYVEIKADCERGWLAGDSQLALFPSGAGCDRTGTLVNPNAFASYTVQSKEGCNVSEICWDYVVNLGGWGNEDTLTLSGCKPWNLGEAPDPASATTCQYFKINTIDPVEEVLGGTIYRGKRSVLSAGPSGFVGAQQYSLKVYVIVLGSNYSHPVLNGSANGAKWSAKDWGRPSTAPATVDASAVVKTGGDTAVTGQIIGYGMYLQRNSGEAELPQWNSAGQVGVTDPGRCSFYIGSKIALTNDERDEPWGTLDEPPPNPNDLPMQDPPAPPDECGDFTLTDASTWASGGICAIAGLLGGVLDVLGSILGVLGGLAAAIGAAFVSALAGLASAIFGPIVDALSTIVGGILDGLVALFDPSEDVGDWAQRLGAKFNDKMPFGIIGDLGSLPGSIPGGGTGLRTTGDGMAAASMGGGCPDWNVKVGPFTNEPIVCGHGFTNAIVGMRPVLLAMMSLLALWPMIRTTMYGSVPIIAAKADKL